MRDHRRKCYLHATNRAPVPMSSLAMDIKLARGQAEPIEPERANSMTVLLDPLEREIFRLTVNSRLPQRDIGISIGKSRFQVCRLWKAIQGKLRFLAEIREKLLADPKIFKIFMGPCACKFCRGANDS